MKTKFFLAAFMFSLAACAYSANGEAANEKLSTNLVDDFYGLIVNTPANVIIEQGEQQTIRFEGASKDLKQTNVKIENGNLVISGTNSNPVTIYITIKEINLIEVNGNSRLYSSAVINSDLLLLKVNGSGSIRLDVRSLSLGMLVKGSGKIIASGSTGTSYSRIYGIGKVITSDLDSFETIEESNSGKQAYRLNILKNPGLDVQPNLSN
ncbi:MAG: hypothetical protein EYC69_13515 [Bacteroidetes bacterium]|nr:MAG: hypothetical protein EYC69_13515 [Bacteroidota bacterium]